MMSISAAWAKAAGALLAFRAWRALRRAQKLGKSDRALGAATGRQHRTGRIEPQRARLMAVAIDDIDRRFSLHPQNCLVRSVALHDLLTADGLDSCLCLGVRNLTGAFEAHAWVEHGGGVLNDDPEIVGAFEVFRMQDTPAASP